MFDEGMAMSFQTSNYPSLVLHNLNKKRIHHRTRTIRVVSAMPPSSSTSSQTDESGKSPESKKKHGSDTKLLPSDRTSSLISQINTVGIIGGVSVDSTLNFLKKLVSLSSKNEEECIPFVLCSDPALNRDLFSLERSSLPYLNRNEIPNLDHTLIVDNLRRKRVFLEKSGSGCIVMPCHMSHTWHNEVSEGCSLPFFHLGECVAKDLKEAKLKPLEAGSMIRIGVLATNATLSAGFYQETLIKEGFEVIVPDKATMEHTVIPATEALCRKDIEGAKNLLRIALQVLLVRGVNTVVLGSDDMRDLLPTEDPLLKKCIDPMDALARTTIKWARSAKEHT